MTGGGSGGHITPILAVARELKQLQPDVRIVYIGQRGDKLSDIPAADPNIDEVHVVSAGKFRRYHGEGWRQLVDTPTQFKNVRDSFRVVAGIWQSYRLLHRIKPSIIFTRGGFVSVPVALAGKLNHIPYVTHDSDSLPSLANRIIARWATLHAVALPEEIYPYPRAKTTMVGIPLSHEYHLVTPAAQRAYKNELSLGADTQVVLVTGGGNGARQLNMAVVANAEYLLKTHPELHIVHIAGRDLETETSTAYDARLAPALRPRVKVMGFITDLYKYSGAADVIIARGGATNLAEFAVQGKACVIVPSKQLVWNVKNSQALAERQAIIELTEAQSEQERRLGTVIGKLLDDDTERAALASRLHVYARPDAAKTLAMVLLERANQR